METSKIISHKNQVIGAYMTALKITAIQRSLTAVAVSDRRKALFNDHNDRQYLNVTTLNNFESFATSS